MKWRLRRDPLWPALLVGAAALLFGQTARATDEIQVYNAGIAAPGQFTIQQHLNYVALGSKDPPFPGGFPPITVSMERRNLPMASPTGGKSGFTCPSQSRTGSSSPTRSSSGPCSFRRTPSSAISSTASISSSAMKLRNSRRQDLASKSGPSSASATPITNSSSTPSSTSASEKTVKRISRRRRAWRGNSARTCTQVSNIIPISARSAISTSFQISNTRCSP
jgi:hypothetical protein